MGKNNKLKNSTPERRNYKLYKAKKQWITACATFLLTFGATTVVGIGAQASTTDSSTETLAAAEITNGPTTVNSTAGTADSTVSLNMATKEAPQTTTNNNDILKQMVGVAKPLRKSDAGEQTSMESNSEAVLTTQSTTTSSKVSVNSDTTDVKNNGVAQAVNKQTKLGSTSPETQSVNAEDIKLNKDNTATLDESKAATQNIKPIPYTINESAYAAAGSTLSNADAALFIQNAKELEEAGATIAWDGTPDTGTAQQAPQGGSGSGKVKITYKDGESTVVDVSFYLDSQVSLSYNGSLYNNKYKSQYSFYYVKNRGDQVDSLTTPDSNGNLIYDPNDQAHSLIALNATTAGLMSDPANGFTIKLEEPLDTSEAGVHWANVQVTEHVPGYYATGGASNFSMVAGTYTFKVPYIVESLKLRTDIPTDDEGNPLIYAQGPTEGDNNGQPTGGPGFDLSASDLNVSTLGQYFYQDYEVQQKS